MAIAGDAFDKRAIRNLVAPRLGLGGEYLSPPDEFLPVPSWPYERLERWHYLSFLKSPQTLDMLTRIERTASTPERLRAFVHLITQELGYQKRVTPYASNTPSLLTSVRSSTWA